MRTRTMRLAAAALAGGTILGLAGCAGQQLGKEPGTIDPGGAESAQAEPAGASEAGGGQPTALPTPVAKDVGTREHPMPAGSTVTDDDWVVALGQPHEGWEEIHEAEPYNEPPKEGTEYWLVPVTITYTGSTSAEPWLDLQFGFVSDDGRSYSDWCAASVPEDLMAVETLYTDATVEANVCLQVPAGGDGLWTVSSDWGDPVFFTAEGR